MYGGWNGVEAGKSGDLSKDGGQEAEGNRESGFGTRLDLAA